jgi:hypothetical protein
MLKGVGLGDRSRLLRCSHVIKSHPEKIMPLTNLTVNLLLLTVVCASAIDTVLGDVDAAEVVAISRVATNPVINDASTTENDRRMIASAPSVDDAADVPARTASTTRYTDGKEGNSIESKNEAHDSFYSE